jgi:RHS repeat-associated protein
VQCNHRHTVLGRRATGKPCDEGTGPYYFGARCYDLEVGRFTSPDPARDGLNWYEYCRQNPLLYVDSDGFKPVKLTAVQGGQAHRRIGEYVHEIARNNPLPVILHLEYRYDVDTSFVKVDIRAEWSSYFEIEQ